VTPAQFLRLLWILQVVLPELRFWQMKTYTSMCPIAKTGTICDAQVFASGGSSKGSYQGMPSGMPALREV
jgi:hypothetical protein